MQLEELVKPSLRSNVSVTEAYRHFHQEWKEDLKWEYPGLTGRLVWNAGAPPALVFTIAKHQCLKWPTTAALALELRKYLDWDSLTLNWRSSRNRRASGLLSLLIWWAGQEATRSRSWPVPACPWTGCCFLMPPKYTNFSWAQPWPRKKTGKHHFA